MEEVDIIAENIEDMELVADEPEVQRSNAPSQKKMDLANDSEMQGENALTPEVEELVDESRMQCDNLVRYRI